ncbi:hypothetical protein [Streptomyces antimycoticus]|uniref:hypothetical protein n=1 Tax=Streptomyces antimycoticus TaxID=68175 RepID=UPI00386B4D54|nr:very short patch repair endonuclease [Streptomyces antimycoticus]
MALRRALHALGFRYRVDLPILGMRRRRADVTFVRWRLAVFVQGCFWHACPLHLHTPVHNREWWREKLRATFDGTRILTPTSSGWGGCL